jgi:SAM-dependent methyltransferase
VVTDYTGADISEVVANLFHKPFYQCPATELPFENSSFDAIWSYAALEHIPEPEKAMKEIRRVLKNQGFLLLAPAWQCRPWAAMGHSVRPYHDFDFKGKIIKLSIPLRNSVLFRSIYVFPRRLFRTIQFVFRKNPVPFKYKKLKPNYDYFCVSDSDALNSMDPYDAILWFISRGDTCISRARRLSKFFVRTGPIIFQKSELPHSKNDH